MTEQGKTFEILITRTKAITSDSYILNTVFRLNSNYSIKKVYINNINSNCNVSLSDHSDINSNSYIIKINQKSFISNAYIFAVTGQTIVSDCHIKYTADINLNSGCNILKSVTVNINQLAVVDTKRQQHISSNYFVESIPKVNLVSPGSGTVSKEPIDFIWQIPTIAGNRPVHFNIQVATDPAFNNLVYDKQSIRDYAEFEYWDGVQWQTMPVVGVASTYYGNNARINLTFLTPQLVYWRVKACTKG